MGFFSNPDCPYCGHELEETGYAFPYPEWRCRTCIRNNRKEQGDKEEISKLKQRLELLEAKEEIIK